MEKLTAKELAQKLDGREYLHELTSEYQRQAVESGLVIIYGRSDDLMEMDGAIDDEGDCYDGGDFYISQYGIVRGAWDNYDCLICKKYLENYGYIEAKWNENGIPWTYETDIPHETFRVYDEGKLYCIGIVFSVDNI